MNDTSAFWIATGQRYIKEARRSAHRLSTVMPDLSRWLITDKETETGIFDGVMVVQDRKSDYWYLDSTRYFNASLGLPYDKLLYLDTDTFVIDPIYDFLGVLEKFELVAVHAPGRRTCPSDNDLPDAFCEINVGVMAFWNDIQITNLFYDWLKRYEAKKDVFRNNDQGPLREALWHSEMPFYVAPPEYNCRFAFGGFARERVKVLHGRPDGMDYHEIAEKVNQEARKMRTWKSGDLC
jgi:hypothetical protein